MFFLIKQQENSLQKDLQQQEQQQGQQQRQQQQRERVAYLLFRKNGF